MSYESNHFENFTEFIKAVRDASESDKVDTRLRLSEDYIKLTIFWISHFYPEMLEQVLRIVYHADEGIEGVDE